MVICCSMDDQPPRAAEAKRFTDGTHRARPPAETVARLQPHLKAMGITRVADVTGLDRVGVPVVMVVRPNARSVAVSQGKGLTLDAAKASGLMESVETWHAERIALPLLLGGRDDLAATHPLVDLTRLPSIEGSRWRPDLAMLWIEGRTLADGTPLWLPYEMVHSNYTVPRPPGHGCFPSSTNGLASGNCFLEAACHALCELIERDATTLWHLLSAERRAATAVALDSIDDANCRHVIKLFEAAGLALSVWETTSDIAVPAYFCLVSEEGAVHGHIGAGAGCHPSRGIALLRALTEAAQTRTTYIAGSRDDITAAEYRPAGIAAKYRFAREVRAGGAAGRDFRDGPGWEVGGFAADLAQLLDRLAAAGCGPAIAVDLTRPELVGDVAVVRAVVPGLEAPHDDVDWQPGPRARAAREASR